MGQAGALMILQGLNSLSVSVILVQCNCKVAMSPLFRFSVQAYHSTLPIEAVHLLVFCPTCPCNPLSQTGRPVFGVGAGWSPLLSGRAVHPRVEPEVLLLLQS